MQESYQTLANSYYGGSLEPGIRETKFIVLRLNPLRKTGQSCFGDQIDFYA